MNRNEMSVKIPLYQNKRIEKPIKFYNFPQHCRGNKNSK